jgi:hypothetical protein
MTSTNTGEAVIKFGPFEVTKQVRRGLEWLLSPVAADKEWSLIWREMADIGSRSFLLLPTHSGS